MWKLWESILKLTTEGPLKVVPNKALFEATDTFLRKPAIVTSRAPHARDVTDLKRVMFIVVIALAPALVFGIYNAGRNAYLHLGVTDATFVEIMLEGAVWVVPLIAISYLIGGFWEGVFAQLRKHEVSEGFLVTGMLYPLICPPGIPWWQYAIGISFGVVIGKEVFGGVGMNILNPALTARAFLFFAYPASISGDVWVPKAVDANGKYLLTTVGDDRIKAFLEGGTTTVDGYTGATALAEAAVNQPGVKSLEVMHSKYEVMDMVLGFIPGSIGETSLIAIGIGALILIITGVGSWRTMVAVFAGGFATAGLFYALAGDSSPEFFHMAPWEHLVIGGFAFGAIFMATDPVSSPFHPTSKLIYGFLIGALCIIIRTINPAYPEGMMLAILFMNVFAPLVDHYVVERALKRRGAAR
jgi:Na+-transporting NADH:ubiquinone oxidoreductase subunit B